VAAKLSEKTVAIRETITNYPDMGNTDIASHLNSTRVDWNITAQDVATQRMKMKDGSGKVSKPSLAASSEATIDADTLVREIGKLASKAGGVWNLKRSVDAYCDMVYTAHEVTTAGKPDKYESEDMPI
jgi:hypothetical protein